MTGARDPQKNWTKLTNDRMPVICIGWDADIAAYVGVIRRPAGLTRMIWNVDGSYRGGDYICHLVEFRPEYLHEFNMKARKDSASIRWAGIDNPPNIRATFDEQTNELIKVEIIK